MKFVVLGASGQLGSEFCRRLGTEAIGLSRGDLDIIQPDALRRTLTALAPGIVINAAAYTQVDRAEDDIEHCRAVNATAVGHLADICRDLNTTLVHFSTDYVFGIDRRRWMPYLETDPPGPLSVYGQTKLEGERLASRCPRHLIVRTCGLYGRRDGGPANNFVESILRQARQAQELRVVNDQICTPTFTRDVVAAVMRLLDASACGLFHVVNRGSTTWYDFAREITSLAGIAATITPVATQDYPRRAQRPAYSVLDTGKYQAATGGSLPDWQAALADYLEPRPRI